MTKYVDKKHGMIIGSDNWFFFHDKEGNFHEFRSIVWCKSYTFETYTFENTYVKTPAEQLIWDSEEIEIDQTYTDKDGVEHKWPRVVIYHTLSHWVKLWLDKNTPGWGCPEDERTNPAIFFAKRSHALAFIKEIERQLKGMEFL